MDINSGKKPDSVQQHTNHGSEQGPVTGSTFKKLPITLSKKELCQILECWPPGRKTPDYDRLRSKFFAEEVLSRIGITPEAYRRTKVFTKIVTIKIIQTLEIENEEPEFAKNHS